VRASGGRTTWESFDGLEIEGLLALPRGSENGSLPLVVFVHGGPTGTWSWAFPHMLVPLLAQEGYAMLFPNPRGSSGRGQDFARANLGDMGGGDLQDILAESTRSCATASRTTRASPSPEAATAASWRRGR
jgi:dipeptidyl aminopeptidase/acylaminoacyl peptidase